LYAANGFTLPEHNALGVYRQSTMTVAQRT
jgi:hypothetical protein